MKRLAYLFCAMFFFATLQSVANMTEFQPAPQSHSNMQDRVWTGAFSLLWNDFKNRIVFDDVRFSDGTPDIAQDLNIFQYSQEYMPEGCYYKIVSKITSSTRRNAVRNIKKKFEETSALLDSVDLTKRNDRILLYTMYKQVVSFTNAFDELGNGKFGEEQNATYFGVNQDTKKNFREDISVLFYNSQFDFAIRINTTGKEYVYLYKTPSNKPFIQLYTEMMLKEKTYYGDKKFSEIDELKIPYLTLNRDYVVEEFCGKRIKGTNVVLDKALASVRFTLANTGEVVKKQDENKKIMQTALTSEVSPRKFYLDDTFVLFLKAKSQYAPYFGLRVNDMTNYQE